MKLIQTLVLGAVLVPLTACGQAAVDSRFSPATPAPTLAPTSAPTAAAPASAPTTAAVTAPTPVATNASTGGSTVTLTIAADGTEARFRAREQLADRPAQSDAIGTTKDVSGGVALGSSGVVKEASKIIVRLESLATDSRLRDRFIKSNTLQTSQYPTAEFIPAGLNGLEWPLPGAGDSTFQLQGDLTIHGVTQPSTWDVTAHFTPDDVTGTASTKVTLDKFGMQKPRVASVLSIEDTITLEIDFHATR